jgi:WD40 repeat protein
VARLGTARLRHGDLVTAVVFTVDGRGLISAGRDGSIRVWDVASGKELRRLVPRADPEARSDLPPSVHCVSLSRDGTLLASGYQDGSVRVWEVRTGRVERRFDAAYRTDIMSVAFSPDGRRLAFCTNQITLCDTATGKLRWRTAALDPLILCLGFTPDGKWLASGSDDGQLCLRDPATGGIARPFEGSAERVSSIAFSPDGRRLISAMEFGTVRLWNATTGRQIREIIPAPGGRRAVAFSPDGKTIAATSWFDAQTRLWDVATGKQLRVFAGYERWTQALAFSRDGKLLAAGGGDGSLRIWDTATGRSLPRFLDRRWPVSALAVSPDGRFLAVADHRLGPFGPGPGSLRLWDLVTTKPVRRQFAPRHAMSFLAFFPDGQRLAAIDQSDDTVRVWEVAGGRELHCYRSADRMNSPVAISKEGRVLALAFARLAAGAGRIEGLDEHDLVAYSADGRRALVGGYKGPLTIRDGVTGKEVRRLPETRHTRTAVALSPDGRWAASADYHGAVTRLWNTATGEEWFHLPSRRYEPDGPTCSVERLAFSPDGRLLACGEQDGLIRLWELATGKERVRFHGHENSVGALAFVSDGRRLASASYDTTVLIWDLLPDELVQQRPLPPAALERLWHDLGSDDAHRAYRAVRELLIAPEQALPWLRTHLHPTPPVSPNRLANLLRELDAPRFAVRQHAAAELAELGELAEPALRQAVAGRPTPEVRRRLEQLLTRVRRRRGELTPEQRQAVRAVEVLEHLPAAEARPILKELAAGAANAPLTRDANAALDWLGRRAGGQP